MEVRLAWATLCGDLSGDAEDKLGVGDGGQLVWSLSSPTGVPIAKARARRTAGDCEEFRTDRDDELSLAIVRAWAGFSSAAVAVALRCCLCGADELCLSVDEAPSMEPGVDRELGAAEWRPLGFLGFAAGGIVVSVLGRETQIDFNNCGIANIRNDLRRSTPSWDRRPAL